MCFKLLLSSETDSEKSNDATVFVSRIGEAQYKLDVAALAKTAGVSSPPDMTQILSQIPVRCHVEYKLKGKTSDSIKVENKW